jgi:hypothetical protein
MIRELGVVGSFVLFLAVPCFSQSVDNSTGQGGASPNIAVDCSDPLEASSAECLSLQDQISGSSRTGSSPPQAQGVPQLKSPNDLNQYQYPPGANPPNPSEIARPKSPTVPQTEFEQMVADSAGRPLPLFGQSLFEQPPSTFAPLDLLQVPNDYIIGPGDQLVQVRSTSRAWDKSH